MAQLEEDGAMKSTAISDSKGAIARLEPELRATKSELDGTRSTMAGMQSPRSRDADERGFHDEISGLGGWLSAAEGEKDELRGQLKEKEEENGALRSKLDDAKAQGDELESQLEESNKKVKESLAEVAEHKSEVARLHTTNGESDRQLEEIAAENEDLLDRLRSTEDGLWKEIEDAGSKA